MKVPGSISDSYARNRQSAKDCCVLNGGDGAWAFEPLAAQLSSALGIDISTEARRFNYVLHVAGEYPADNSAFIPNEAVRLASDKRLLAAVFSDHDVPTLETHLLDRFEQVVEMLRERNDREWCLKYPTSCGAGGHRRIAVSDGEPPNWPRPFILQEFIRMDEPEVYRTYCTGGQVFGWSARRFPDGVPGSPWVAHARGARYECVEDVPIRAANAAHRALVATGLWDSFGCADLIQAPSGEWLVLEVGTDGLFNHVDRDMGNPQFEQKLLRRIADAFWRRFSSATGDSSR